MYPCLKILLEYKNILVENVLLAVSGLFFHVEIQVSTEHMLIGPWLARGADSVWRHRWNQGELSGCSLYSHPDDTRSALLYEMGAVSAVQWALLSVALSLMQKQPVEIWLHCVVGPVSLWSICTWKCVSAGLVLRLHLCNTGSLGSELH